MHRPQESWAGPAPWNRRRANGGPGNVSKAVIIFEDWDVAYIIIIMIITTIIIVIVITIRT